MRFKIIEGSVRLNEIVKMIDSSEIILLNVDASTKYYRISSFYNWDSEGNETIIVELMVDDNTLRTDDKLTSNTQIRIDFEEGESWSVDHDSDARYGFEIFLRNHNAVFDNAEIVWSKD